MTLRLSSLTLFAALLVWCGVCVECDAQTRTNDGASVHAPALFSSLTRDVDSIASAGVPGPLAAFSDRALPIISGRLDKASSLPVVVASEWDRGRVVAFGHGGMIGGKALEHEGTRRFLENCIEWLAGIEPEKAKQTRIGIRRNNELAALLREQGFEVRALDGQVATWSDSLADLHAVVIDAHQIDDAMRPVLARYVQSGGGLLTAGLGWGWLQLNPGRTIHEHPGNLLLRDAGIAWCDDTLDATRGDDFIVNRIATVLHARHALDALEVAAMDGSPLDPQAGSTLTSVLRTLPRTHDFFARTERVLGRQETDLTISEKSPLRRADALRRVIVALQREVESHTPSHELSMHPSASVFPGSVPADAPRVAREVTVDCRVTDWHSTGLYAPPGEVIEVTWQSDTPGFRVRIGCHTDTLWHLDAWRRVPDIARQWDSNALSRDDVNTRTTRVCSPFGGLIYIDIPRRSEISTRFTIRRAVEAPRFVLGQTPQEAWLTSRNAPAPWGELESDKVIISVPSAALRTLDDPAPLMEFWNAISDAHATLATIPLTPPRPHRFVADVQISAGYMHSGYPIMTHLDAVDAMTNLNTLRRGSWGLLHELGHNHQVGDWTFDGTVEVTCNLFSLHAIDTVCTPEPGTRGHVGVNTPPDWKSYINRGADFREWKRDPFLALHMYVQLQHAFGWETYKQVFAEYRNLPREQRPRNDQEKRDQWMVRFSRACGRNLGEFFQAWGVPTSESARASLADLPVWMPEDWPSR